MLNKTYIIIVSYNGSKWIQKCLESCSNYPIIVVDNNSTDKTISIIENEFPEVILIKQTNNLGFGKANNIGIRKALDLGADYVFLLNQDAYLVGDTIEDLINIHLSNLDYGILSPIHLNGEGNRLDRNFSYYLSYDKNNEFYSDFILNTNLKNKLYEVPFVNAAAWLLPKSTLKNIGGFDPIFFHYGEDNNYCQKLIKEGFKVGVVSDCYIKHDRENISKSLNLTTEHILQKFKTQSLVKHSNITKNVNVFKNSKSNFIKQLYLYIYDKHTYKLNKEKQKISIETKIKGEVSIKKFINRKDYQYL